MGAAGLLCVSYRWYFRRERRAETAKTRVCGGCRRRTCWPKASEGGLGPCGSDASVGKAISRHHAGRGDGQEENLLSVRLHRSQVW